MAREVNFVTGTIVTASWLNDQQEVKSALHFGIRLERASATQIQLKPLDDGNDEVAGQSSLIVDGKPRWFNSTITKTVSGAKGTYSIYVIAGESTTLEAGNITLTTGAAPANSRKIGEVDWSGAAIERIRQNGMGSTTGAMIEDGALSSAGAVTWTREPGGGLLATINNGAVTDADLASPSLARNDVLWQGCGRVVGKLGAGQYVLAAANAGGINWLKTTALTDEERVEAHRFSVADIYVPNKTAKLLVRFSYFAPNGIAPGQELTAKLSELGESGPHWSVTDYHETTQVGIPSGAGLQRSALTAPITVVNYGLGEGKTVTNSLIVPSIHLPGELATENLTVWAELLLTYV
jgi:hypothetical protein